MTGQAKFLNLDAVRAELLRGGFEQIRFQITQTRRRVTAVRGRQIKQVLDADDWMCVVEAEYNGFTGRAYWSRMPDPERLAGVLRETARMNRKKSDICYFSEPARSVRNGAVFEDHDTVSGRLLEAAAHAYQRPEVVLLQDCSYEQREDICYFIDPDGNTAADASAYHFFQAAVNAGAGSSRSQAQHSCYGASLEQIDAIRQIDHAVRKAADILGAGPIASGRYQVILESTVMAGLLEAYLPAFYAENTSDSRSVLTGRKGKRIAAPCVELREVPRLPGGRSCRRIDDEGCPVSGSDLIRAGIMKTELTNRHSGAESGLPLTGNGFKPDSKAEVGTGVTNVILGPAGEKALGREELIGRMNSGLVVTGLEGIFAGTDVKTGDFSLQAKGVIIKDGIIAGAFKEVTIAGNFCRMLEQIIAFGDEPAATGPDQACVLSPSVYVGALAVSGE